LINQSVHTSDDVDIGDIDALIRDFTVVKRGPIFLMMENAGNALTRCMLKGLDNDLRRKFVVYRMIVEEDLLMLDILRTTEPTLAE